MSTRVWFGKINLYRVLVWRQLTGPNFALAAAEEKHHPLFPVLS